MQKYTFFPILREKADAEGRTLIDGTNYSDDAGDRPGMKALKEMNVLSPLRECKLTKVEIRKLSEDAGLLLGISLPMPVLLQEYLQEQLLQQKI